MAINPTNITLTATDKTERAFNAVKNRFDSLNKKVTSVQGKIVSLAGAAGFGALTNKLLSTADRIGKVSAQVGISTESLQKFQFAAGQSGASTEVLNKSLQKFNRVTGDAITGNKASIASFESLGINILDASGSAKSAEDLFKESATAISQLGTDAEKASAANKLFGRSGVELLPLLNAGAEGIEEYGRKLEQTGGVMSDNFVKSSEALNDVMDITTRSFETSFSVALEGLLPILQDVAGFVGKVGKSMGEFAKKHPQITLLGAAITGVSIAVSLLGGKITLIIGAVTLITTGLGKFQEVIVKTWESVKGFTQSIIESINPFSGLMSIFDDGSPKIEKNAKAMDDFQEKTKKTTPEVKSLSEMFSEMLEESKNTNTALKKVKDSTKKLTKEEKKRTDQAKKFKGIIKEIVPNTEKFNELTAITNKVITDLMGEDGLGGISDVFWNFYEELKIISKSFLTTMEQDFKTILTNIGNAVFFKKNEITEAFDNLLSNMFSTIEANHTLFNNEWEAIFNDLQTQIQNATFSFEGVISVDPNEVFMLNKSVRYGSSANMVPADPSEVFYIDPLAPPKSYTASQVLEITGVKNVDVGKHFKITGGDVAFQDGGNISTSFEGRVSETGEWLRGNFRTPMDEANSSLTIAEQGGYIRGSLHSMGGVNINAEGGEYIINRRDVSRIGRANLDRLNNGGSMGGVEVNIYDGTGQVISEYDSALRVEIKERADRFEQFSAVR